MKLTDGEQRMLDGEEGAAKQKAMDLLVRYGKALGAERLVDTHNVCGTVGASGPFLRDFAARGGGLDAVFCEFNLDSSETVPIPGVQVFTCQIIQGMDPDHWQIQGIAADVAERYKENGAYMARIGVQPTNTCVPYQLGNVPVMGEHCAWMESSAVVYCNSVLGARTNTEGRESAGAAMLTGRIPYWGYHLDENRLGTHLVEVEWDVRDVMDWGLLGYYVGQMVQDKIPVLTGIRDVPNFARLKHFGAAASSSGGVELYHLVGITPEARTLQEAFGSKQPVEKLKFGTAERKAAYETLNGTAQSADIDYVMLGCPHYTIEQIWEVCRLLQGKRVHPNTSLWIFTARTVKELADRNGYTSIIRDAGGYLMSDTCSAAGQVIPKGVRVAATDSAKQAHYLPAILGIQTFFGSTEACIRAALTGKWQAELEPRAAAQEHPLPRQWEKVGEGISGLPEHGSMTSAAALTLPSPTAPGEGSGLSGAESAGSIDGPAGSLALHGRTVVGGYAEGEAIVTRDMISGWGGMDPMTGTITEMRHELRGQSFKGKVLVFPGAKGSSAWSHRFHVARLAGTAPAALLFNETNTKVALGAVVLHVPALTEFDKDPLAIIATGDWVKVDADAGVVEIIKRQEPGEALGEKSEQLGG